MNPWTNGEPMDENGNVKNSTPTVASGDESGFSFQPPSLNLPKGGGEIKGLDEKLGTVNSSGTLSLSVPIFTSPGRGGFSPSLGLSYDSGSGNSPFGLGWTLSIPAITRKTQQGLPRYQDEIDSDVFMLSGSEDLVPALNKNGDHWEPQIHLSGKYKIKSYRPRIESAFARIEKWMDIETGDTHWRTRSRENILNIFGASNQSRISDPENPSHIFSWLLEETHDDHGNIILYEYQQENMENVESTLLYEKSRHQNGNSNQYLKRIVYGNQKPFIANDWLFEVVFDYGDHPQGQPEPDSSWLSRPDAFSSYRSGFEIRTRRLCHRVLMFHHFTELSENPYLVRSTDFTYREDAIASQLISVTQTGYKKSSVGNYEKKSLPPVEFEYSSAELNHQIQSLNEESKENLPAGADDQTYRWQDLDGEGLTGLLSQINGGWHYKRNLGQGRLGSLETVNKIPQMVAGQFMALESNGLQQLVSFDSSLPGFYDRAEDSNWGEFTAFKYFPTRPIQDPNSRLIDLTGDGQADILITEDDQLLWYPSLGKQGFDAAYSVRKTLEEDEGLRLVFADANESIYLANMGGDGLTDLVRMRNGSIDYWPNLGYGHFGRKVSMSHAPRFDTPDAFEQSRLRLADINGSGTADILYIGTHSINLWFNQSGNGWSLATEINSLPDVDDLSNVEVTDLMGRGTACLVWSSPHLKDAHAPIRYIDLIGESKPYLLKGYKNNMGHRTEVRYAPSTRFYVEDKLAGSPWITRLPFPVYVVEQVSHHDDVMGTHFTSRYRYKHGCYDYNDREFRGFGLVESWDTDSFEHFKATGARNAEQEDMHQLPVHTKTWYHTGSFFFGPSLREQYEKEFYNQDSEARSLKESLIPKNLSTEEEREVLRALKGSPIRSEVYAEDGTDLEKHPYSVSETRNRIRLIQPKDNNEHTVVFAEGLESLSYHYERNAADPRISHSLTLETDEYANVLKSASIGYSRRIADSGLPDEVQDEQAKIYIVCSETKYTNDIDEEGIYRLRLPCEARSFELTGITPNDGTFFQVEELLAAIQSASTIAFEISPDSSLQKRLLKHSRSLYLKDDLSGPLPFGIIGSLGMGYQSYQLALTLNLIDEIFDDRVDDTLMAEGGYVHSEGDSNWWVPSGTAVYPTDAAQHFYLPTGSKDPFGNVTTVEYDPYDLFAQSTSDPLGNRVSAEYDYRLLQPVLITDPNDNQVTVETDVLGMVIKSAIKGKAGAGEGDTLDDPTTEMEYDLFNWMNHKKPNFVKSRAREQHGPANTRWQEKYEYSDGGGNVVMVKAQAEPGLALRLNEIGEIEEVNTTPNLRWVGNGRTVLNNKGNPIKQYEPYFSTTPEYEDDKQMVEIGVSPIVHYDSMDRAIKTENPDGTFTKVEFDPWKQISWDANDTVLESQWYVDRGSPDPTEAEPLDSEKRAAWLAAQHANTPAIQHTDSLGRGFLSISDNGQAGQYITRTVLDVEGNTLAVVDARENTVMRYRYDMLPSSNEKEPKPALFQDSMDGGEKWKFMNVVGNPNRGWDSRDHVFRSEYDELHRPTHSWVKPGAATEQLIGKNLYGESFPDAKGKNLRGQAIEAFDQAGLVKSLEFDFKGNLLQGSRTFTKDYKQTIDWNEIDTISLWQEEVFKTSSEYDALNRLTKNFSPHHDSLLASEMLPVYNESGALNEVRVKLHGNEEETVFIRNINYDAKGQRQRIDYGNNVITKYDYDPKTFRLRNLKTLRNESADLLQDLNYHYDPVGNITEIQDDSQATHFFNNTVVEPSSKYVYDALYRLVHATGREHIGQNQPSEPLSKMFPKVQPGDGKAMRRYSQEYQYDGVGNILSMIHQAHDSSGAYNWQLHYQYAEDSNRLLATSRPDDDLDGPYSDSYSYNNHGSMTSMPHLSEIQWDHLEQLNQVELGGGGTAYYVYDASGQRTRKIREHNGSTTEERIYLGGWEIYRKHTAGQLKFERETLHIMNGQQRIALVETKTVDNGVGLHAPVPLIRYQLGNHLASASLELSDNGTVVSYEEFHPYGTTAYHATTNDVDESPKRYRYTGKERDEETGFSYHGARYLACWLGRWVSLDPAGIGDGVNLYAYVNNNPMRNNDPTGLIKNDTVILGDGLDGVTDEIIVYADDIDETPPEKFTVGKGLAFAAGIVVGLVTGIATAILITAAIAALPVSAAVATAIGVGVAVGGLGYAGSQLYGNWDDIKETTRELSTGEASAGKYFGAGIILGGIFSIPFGGKAGATGKAIGGTAREVIFAEGSAALGSIEARSVLTATSSRALAAEATAAEAAASGGSLSGEVAANTINASETLVGASKSSMRSASQRIIKNDPEHPLQFLLNAKNKFFKTKGLKQPELIEDSKLVQMGHRTSNKQIKITGDPEQIVLQTAYRNQWFKSTIEARNTFGMTMGKIVELGGIAVEYESALIWVEQGYLAEEILLAAPTVIF
jgi:RHS repeat-associated protein